MKIQISGKHIEIGETLPKRVREKLESAVDKHFDGGAESHVVFSREGSEFRADCTTHLDSGMTIKSEGHAADAYKAFDQALAKLEKQVRRYKRRKKNYREKTGMPRAQSA
jgi:ribosomal subunit interface protein